MSNLDQARRFFDACETGKGWEGCKAWCHPDATFDSQTAALAGINTLEAYCNWMQNLFTPLPDARYELKFMGEDADRDSVAAYAVIHATQSGPGGPVPPTGRTIAADYVYNMVFDGGRIRHMTKIWNDAHSMQQMGWS
ncbi:MAG: nuclear transport factor 2 family protein [Pseudomonadales bacterium]|nr:nuclear transport factor 2 family protein [Pseudomonadales bacterium]MCP5183291.1 nuclear transport factor 2 family protein [Pseudomonadales bacterium]